MMYFQFLRKLIISKLRKQFPLIMEYSTFTNIRHKHLIFGFQRE